MANPEQPISELPLLTEAERHRMVVEWNDTARDYPRDRCIHELFEEQVGRTPDAVAVLFEDERLTYCELNRRANQLAHYLRRLGVGPEVRVGICVERSLEMVVGLLGILKAGGAYVPLDPSYPKERLSFMLEDAAPLVLLTQQRLVEELPRRHAAQLVCLDAEWPVIARESEENPEGEATADNLAYIIYTSGSTGVPKGVMVEHRSVVRLVQNTDYLEFQPDDVFLQLAPLAFDASTFEIWGPLLNGGLLALAPPGRLGLAELAATIRRHEVSTLWLTAGLFHQLLDAEPAALGGVRNLLAGGDVLSPAHVREALRCLPGTRLINGYGPTENTTFTCCFPMSAAAPPPEGPVPIGRPIANTQVYLLDRDLNPVPIGVTGELYAGGEGLARGYLGRPELTAERFIPDPFSGEPGARLYRTGDLARYRSDGDIEFLGRIDNQVKVRGFRVEPGEVEAALAGHMTVREAVVVAREEEPGDKRLVAYVVPAQRQAPATSELRAYLKEKLPEYMMPSAFVALNALPLTPHGKVDRKALPAPVRSRPELGSVFVAPHDELEERLVEICEEVLGIERVGVHDDFFELGGDSLLATKVISRIRDAFKVELPMCDLFESPTVTRLAEKIHLAASQEQNQLVPVIQPVSRHGKLPVSFSQEQVWFLQHLVPENFAYNSQATLRFMGPLDVAALERSLGEIVRRHEIFRTTFPAVHGRPIQRIHDAWPVTLPVLDVQMAPESEREADAHGLIGRELQRPFDLTRLPLVRWTLIRLAPHEHVLVHVEHHLIHDGWSFNVFLRELQELYRAFAAGKPSPLREPPIQFADFAVWQRQWMQGEVAEAQLAYWTEKLAGSPPVLELPTDRSRPAEQTFRGASSRVELPLGLCEALRAVSRREGVTLFMTMLAGFLALLHRYTGQKDVCVGTGVANRRLRETEGLIGMIINTVALRTDLSADPTFQELLSRVREVTLEAYAHQDLPFGKVVEALQPERSLSYSPLYQVLFSFHDAPMPDLDFPGMNTSLREALGNGSAKSDLGVIVIPRSGKRVGPSRTGEADGITLVWEYSTDLFDDTTIERLVRHYQKLLEGIVADPDRRLSNLPLLTEAERRQLLVEWNNTAAEYPQDKCVHELFEEQAERTPDAVAVIFEDQYLTYRELNRRANQLAHYLRGLGVGPEVLVGVCVERSLEMVVGLLGILKAGGAYLPLDPAYPNERLKFMLKDTRAPVLLTQERLLINIFQHEAKIVCLDRDWKKIAQEVEENPQNAVVSENLAYVIYTSGSTGEPKGVCISSGAIASHCRNVEHVYKLNSNDCVLQFAPVNFDASLEQILPTLIVGAKLLLRDPHVWTATELLKHARDIGITVANFPTAYWHQLVQQSDQSAKVALSNQLRLVIVGGDQMRAEGVRSWQQSLTPSMQLLNAYGPTETTITATIFEISPQFCGEGHLTTSIPIGRPLPNRTTYVLDPNLQLVPIGVPGELHIGEAGLAWGYLNRPELTAEKFVPDPFSGKPGARLYKTGDLARYLPDGNIEFLGRLDHQVKIRGFRVEPGEVEAVLAQHPAVREAVVVAREDKPNDKRLVAYVVPAQRQPPATSELRGYLQEKLPEYMVPSAVTVLEELPLTPNDKVDRRALPAPDHSMLHPENGYVEPRSPVEGALVGIWEEVLGLERVGVHDDFFELGGHSLLATQLVSRLREALQVELPLRYLFETPTVAELAERIEACRRLDTAPSITTPSLDNLDEEERL